MIANTPGRVRILRFPRGPCMWAVLVGLIYLGPLQAQPQLSDEVRARVRAATVYIECFYQRVDEPKGRPTGPFSGTGFIVAEEGLVMTNNHVVSSVKVLDARSGAQATEATLPENLRILRLESVTVRLQSGLKESRVFPASVVGTRPFPIDLALLRIRPDRFLPALDLLGEEASGQLRETDAVWAVGFPLGAMIGDILAGEPKLASNPFGPDLTFRDGTISSRRRDGQGKVQVLDTTCLTEPGNSGGPLVTREGVVVGINYYGGGRNFSFAIPSPTALNEFSQTLAMRNRTDAVKRKARRLLVSSTERNEYFRRPVEPLLPSPSTDSWVSSLISGISAAARDANPGDTIHVPAGRFEIDQPLVLPPGVRLTGAGIGKTILVLRSERSFVSISGRGYREMSDLTLLFENPKRVRVPEYLVHLKECDGETFIHDVEVVTGPWESSFIHPTSSLGIEGGSPNIVNCIIRPEEANFDLRPIAIRVREEGTAARLERLRVDGGIVGLRIEDEASPVVAGCLFSRRKGPPTSERIRTGIRIEGASLEAVGCHFDFPASEDQPCVLILGKAQVRLVANYLPILGLREAISVSEAADATVTNNIFRHPMGRPSFNSKTRMIEYPPQTSLIVDGPRTQASITRNLFINGHWEARNGAQVVDSGNKLR